jgi:predicted glycosyltransferase involved in capsule biosynthesis
MQLSALFPYRPDSEERDYIWSMVRKRYGQLFPQIEICIGTDESKLFCRAHAVNEAAKKATGDVFIIVDMDVVFNLEVIDQITRLVNDHPWIVPYSQGLRLSQKASKRLFEQGLPEKIQHDDADVEIIVTWLGPFMNVMTRKCFEAIGGMDERFKGWGREDAAMVLALDTICGKHFRMEGVVYHLWHQRPVLDSTSYGNNHRLYLQYEAAGGNVEAMHKVINDRYDTRKP